MEFNGVAFISNGIPRTAMPGRKFHARNARKGRMKGGRCSLSVEHASGRKKTTRCLKAFRHGPAADPKAVWFWLERVYWREPLEEKAGSRLVWPGPFLAAGQDVTEVWRHRIFLC